MIPEWLRGKTVAVYDLETDFIPTTQIFMCGVGIISFDNLGVPTIADSKIYTAKWAPYTNGSLMQAITIINSCDYNVAHNGVGFDEPEVTKHLGTGLTSITLDTLIISKIMISKDELFSMDIGLGLDKDLYGSYSLKAFGQRLGDAKIDYEDFSEMNEEMAIYCNQDVDLTVRLFINLINRDNFPLWNVVELEHKAAAIIAEQTKFGFYLDIDKARKLNTELLTEKGNLARELATIFKPKWLKDGPVKTYKKLSKVRKYLPNKDYKKPW
jgi:hypothetical protein